MECTICKGTKVMNITINSYLSGKEPTTEKMEIKCIHCDGSGTMTQDDIDHLEWEKDQWCKCGSHSGARYIPDNVSDICDKHHWLCNVCDKITQVG